MCHEFLEKKNQILNDSMTLYHFYERTHMYRCVCVSVYVFSQGRRYETQASSISENKPYMVNDINTAFDI